MRPWLGTRATTALVAPALLAVLLGCTAEPATTAAPAPATPAVTTAPATTEPPTTEPATTEPPTTEPATPETRGPAPSGSPAGSAATPPAAEQDEPSAVPFRATTTPDRGRGAGSPLTVTAVRVGVHPGYDRIVFELDGPPDGRPGWLVRYTDPPRQQGSGSVVPVQGTHALTVLITPTSYPFDSEQRTVERAPALPSGMLTVTDLRLGSTYEGNWEAWIGTDAEQPFRVFRLADPRRVVVDVQHR